MILFGVLKPHGLRLQPGRAIDVLFEALYSSLDTVDDDILSFEAWKACRMAEMDALSRETVAESPTTAFLSSSSEEAKGTVALDKKWASRYR